MTRGVSLGSGPQRSDIPARMQGLLTSLSTHLPRVQCVLLDTRFSVLHSAAQKLPYHCINWQYDDAEKEDTPEQFPRELYPSVDLRILIEFLVWPCISTIIVLGRVVAAPGPKDKENKDRPKEEYVGLQLYSHHPIAMPLLNQIQDIPCNILVDARTWRELPDRHGAEPRATFGPSSWAERSARSATPGTAHWPSSSTESLL